VAPVGIGPPGGRFAAITVAVAAAANLLVRSSQVPGISAALVGLALIIGLAGWAFQSSGDPRMRLRRDLFFGIGLGIPIGVGLTLLLR
jgi:hypothetical protein